jgi:hypothetical protein
MGRRRIESNRHPNLAGRPDGSAKTCTASPSFASAFLDQTEEVNQFLSLRALDNLDNQKKATRGGKPPSATPLPPPLARQPMAGAAPPLLSYASHPRLTWMRSRPAGSRYPRVPVRPPPYTGSLEYCLLPRGRQAIRGEMEDDAPLEDGGPCRRMAGSTAVPTRPPLRPVGRRLPRTATKVPRRGMAIFGRTGGTQSPLCPRRPSRICGSTLFEQDGLEISFICASARGALAAPCAEASLWRGGGSVSMIKTAIANRREWLISAGLIIAHPTDCQWRFREQP